MKRIGLQLSTFCFALAIVLLSAVPVFASEAKEESKAEADKSTLQSESSEKNDADNNAAELTINGKAKAKVGDIVTYTLNLSDTLKPIVGFDMCLFFDSQFLEYQKGSLKFDNFEPVIYNEDLDGRIPMNYSSLTSDKVFSKKSQFVSADFKVIAGGASDITYFVTEMYAENFETEPYLKSYTFTYDLTGGTVDVKDEVPLVDSGTETQRNYQGDFVNYADGMGEDNSPQTPENHQKIGIVVQTSVVDVTQVVSGQNDGASGSQSNHLLFYILAGVLVVGAVVAAVVIVSLKGKKEESSTIE